MWSEDFDEFDHIVSPSGSCVLHIKEHLHGSGDKAPTTIPHKIYELVELHVAKTVSSCGVVLLTQWDKLKKNLIRLTPKA